MRAQDESVSRGRALVTVALLGALACLSGAVAGCSTLAEIGSWTLDAGADGVDAGPVVVDATSGPDVATDAGVDDWRLDAARADADGSPDAAPGDAAGHPLEIAPVADSSVRRGLPNTNHGVDVRFHVGGSLVNVDRSLLRFATEDVARALGTGTLRAAKLRLTVDLEAVDTTFTASPLEAHAMTRAWTELGATWSCADEVSPEDSSKSCGALGEWFMDLRSDSPWSPGIAGSVGMTRGMTSVELDLTAEVQRWLNDPAGNLGIILLLPGDRRNAWVNFQSRESGTIAGRPVLALEVDERDR